MSGSETTAFFRVSGGSPLSGEITPEGNTNEALPLLAAACLRHTDPSLLSACPHCQHSLRFNPFFAAAEDSAEVLRRGLEYSRREKGADHEETLAHLAALAVHLENSGKPEEAAEFQREHDALAAKLAAKKK
jgi:hypothetical protein